MSNQVAFRVSPTLIKQGLALAPEWGCKNHNDLARHFYVQGVQGYSQLQMAQDLAHLNRTLTAHLQQLTHKQDDLAACLCDLLTLRSEQIPTPLLLPDDF